MAIEFLTSDKHIVELLILLFILVTFLQSGSDKIMDWEGNVAFFKDHFSGTLIEKMIIPAVLFIIILEIASAVSAVLGIIYLLMDDIHHYAYYAFIISSITYIILIFGQRIAKDYQGAHLIAISLAICLFGLYVLSNS